MSIRRIRRTVIWILIPSVSSIVTGMIVKGFGLTNLGVFIISVIVGACAIEAGIEKHSGTAIGVACWGLNVFTGMLLNIVVSEMFGDMKTWLYILCLAGLVIAILINIAYAKEMWKDVKTR